MLRQGVKELSACVARACESTGSMDAMGSNAMSGHDALPRQEMRWKRCCRHLGLGSHPKFVARAIPSLVVMTISGGSA